MIQIAIGTTVTINGGNFKITKKMEGDKWELIRKAYFRGGKDSIRVHTTKEVRGYLDDTIADEVVGSLAKGMGWPVSIRRDVAVQF